MEGIAVPEPKRTQSIRTDSRHLRCTESLGMRSINGIAQEYMFFGTPFQKIGQPARGLDTPPGSPYVFRTVR